MDKKRWTRGTPEAITNASARMRDAVSRGSDRTTARAREMNRAIREAAADTATLIAGMEGPAVPLQEAWSVGLGDILRDHPELPGMLRAAVGHLNRLGHLRISSDSISFDGTSVAWEKIEEIKFGSASGLLMSRAIEHEIGRLTAGLPQMPGSDWLVRQAVEVLVALCHAAVAADDSGDSRSQDGVGEAPVGVPVTITYRTRLRRKELTPGVFVTLVASLIPNTPQAIAAIARERDIKITTMPPSRYHRQAIVMRELAAALSDRLRQRGEPRSVESAEAVEEANEPDTVSKADRPSAPRTEWLPAEQAAAPELERGPDEAQASS